MAYVRARHFSFLQQINQVKKNAIRLMKSMMFFVTISTVAEDTSRDWLVISHRAMSSNSYELPTISNTSEKIIHSDKNQA
jgi:negative regulator of sigma E activity